MYSRVQGQPPLLLSSNYISTVGFLGDPSDLLCTQKSNWSHGDQITPTQFAERSKSSHPCQFLIPTPLSAHLKSQTSEVIQVLLNMDNPLLTTSNPPISTTVVAMELNTPQRQLIPIQDLDPEQAIQVTLPNKYPLAQKNGGGDGNEGASEAKNEACLSVTLPKEGQLNFIVKALDGLDENAGLYISFNFSLAPGTVALQCF